MSMGQELITERVQAVLSSTGLSQRQFAAKLGLDPSQLSRSLHGQRRFTSLELARIAEFGEVSVDWLLGLETPAQAAARVTSSDRSGTAEAVDAASSLVQLRLDLAEIGAAETPLTLPVGGARGSMVEQGMALAAAALTHAGVTSDAGPLRDLPGLVESAFGVDVRISPLPTDVDGVAVRSGDAAAIVVATTRLLPRQRFTIAHELAHVICEDDQGLHVDVASGPHRPDLSEVRANAFAASLLMPELWLRQRTADRDSSDQQLLDDLVVGLVVSPSALAHRMYNLGLLDERTRDEYVRQSLRGVLFRSHRFVLHSTWIDEASRTRVPLRLLADLWSAYERGDITLRPIAQLLGRDPEELRAESEWTGPAPEAYSPA